MVYLASRSWIRRVPRGEFKVGFGSWTFEHRIERWDARCSGKGDGVLNGNGYDWGGFDERMGSMNKA
jgi:hypothetical protein